MSREGSERIAVVTGASRGAGKGIALALGAAGATVYITGRTTQTGTNPLPGTIYETAEQVTQAGGKGVAVVCDLSSTWSQSNHCDAEKAGHSPNPVWCRPSSDSRKSREIPQNALSPSQVAWSTSGI